MPLRPGFRVDRYTLVEQLGEGGQGAVWKVFDPVAKAGRALKLIDLARRPATALERARREARALASLDHPALVRCHALFELPADDLLGLVFDLVRGRPLSHLIDDPRLSHDLRLAVLDHVAAALAYVHARGIAHRDLKPENVVVADAFFADPARPGTVRLIDFGIAAPVGNPRPITTEGWIVGTDRYLPPEILLPGRKVGSDDGVARDLFAFGVLAWELVTCAHPTGAPAEASAATYARSYDDAFAGKVAWPPAGLEGPSASFVATCLALDPMQRLDAAPMLGKPLQLAPSRRRAAVAAVTAPREVPAQAPFVASTPPPQRRPAPLPNRVRPPRAGHSWMTVALVFALGLLCFAGVVAAVMWMKAEGLARQDSPAPPSTTSPASSARAPAIPATTTPRPTPAPLPLPCCPALGKCLRNHPCGPGACRAELPPHDWRLRVTGVVAVAPNGSLIDMRFAVFDVCIARAAEEWRCVPILSLEADANAASTYPLQTSDLENGSLRIRVRGAAGGDLVAGPSPPPDGGLNVAALCRGVKLYVGPREPGSLVVMGVLDDASP